MDAKYYIKLSARITVFVGCLVLLGWFFNYQDITQVLPGMPTMKFNTAFSFVLIGTSLLLFKQTQSIFVVIRKLFIVVVLFIAVFTCAQYLFYIEIGIDNLFVHDTFSHTNPGRMSLATTICFFLIGISFFIPSKNKLTAIFFQVSILLVVAISFISVLTFSYGVSTQDKFFMDTMALHTALLFLIISIAMLLSYSDTIGVVHVFRGTFSGSQLMRKFFPILVSFPFISGFVLLWFIKREVIALDFGVAIFTFFLIISSIIYTYLTAQDFNKYDKEKTELQSLLSNSNQELKQFKDALDKIAIVAITDQKGVITYVNDLFCEISQYKSEELIGKTHAIINSGYHSKSFFADLWKTIATGKVWVGEIKNKAKNGSFYWVFTAIVPFKNKTGKITQYLAIRQDITKKKEAEDLLSSRYVQQLELKNKELEQFAYIASHDLQEPLSTVKDFVGKLGEKLESNVDKDVSRYFTYIHQASTRMSKLILGLLEYSRIGKNSNLKSMDCNSLIQEIKTEMSETITKNNVEITYTNLPEIRVYPKEFKQLFTHLISNAIKFKRTKVSPKIHVSAHYTDNFWEFKVTDNGIGIEKKYLEKIFVIYQRLHLEHEFSGTGIGLAHCRKIVNLHGGKIWVTSILGEGSTFHFTIFHS